MSILKRLTGRATATAQTLNKPTGFKKVLENLKSPAFKEKLEAGVQLTDQAQKLKQSFKTIDKTVDTLKAQEPVTDKTPVEEIEKEAEEPNSKKKIYMIGAGVALAGALGYFLLRKK